MTANYLFFDTYAIIEIIRGNENYLPYTNSDFVLTKLNAFELFYNIMKNFGKEKALVYLNKYGNKIIEFDNMIIIKAAEFRLTHKNRNLSMADCIGYVLATSLGIKFLTGDEQFRNMENVEFVK